MAYQALPTSTTPANAIHPVEGAIFDGLLPWTPPNDAPIPTTSNEQGWGTPPTYSDESQYPLSSQHHHWATAHDVNTIASTPPTLWPANAMLAGSMQYVTPQVSSVQHDLGQSQATPTTIAPIPASTTRASFSSDGPVPSSQSLYSVSPTRQQQLHDDTVTHSQSQQGHHHSWHATTSFTSSPPVSYDTQQQHHAIGRPAITPQLIQQQARSQQHGISMPSSYAFASGNGMALVAHPQMHTGPSPSPTSPSPSSGQQPALTEDPTSMIKVGTTEVSHHYQAQARSMTMGPGTGRTAQITAHDQFQLSGHCPQPDQHYPQAPAAMGEGTIGQQHHTSNDLRQGHQLLPLHHPQLNQHHQVRNPSQAYMPSSVGISQAQTQTQRVVPLSHNNPYAIAAPGSARRGSSTSSSSLAAWQGAPEVYVEHQTVTGLSRSMTMPNITPHSGPGPSHQYQQQHSSPTHYPTYPQTYGSPNQPRQATVNCRSVSEMDLNAIVARGRQHSLPFPLSSSSQQTPSQGSYSAAHHRDVRPVQQHHHHQQQQQVSPDVFQQQQQAMSSHDYTTPCASPNGDTFITNGGYGHVQQTQQNMTAVPTALNTPCAYGEPVHPTPHHHHQSPLHTSLVMAPGSSAGTASPAYDESTWYDQQAPAQQQQQSSSPVENANYCHDHQQEYYPQQYDYEYEAREGSGGLQTIDLDGAPPPEDDTFPASPEEFKHDVHGAESSTSVDSSRPAGGKSKKNEAKKPFLACKFCRGRKIQCGPGPKLPPEIEATLPPGPRTCNQCHKRGLVCRFPEASRRGLRGGKPSRLVVYEADNRFKIVEDEYDLEEGSPVSVDERTGATVDCWDSNSPTEEQHTGKKGKGKKRGPPRPWSPMRFVPAVDTEILKELTARGVLLPVVVPTKNNTS